MPACITPLLMGRESEFEPSYHTVPFGRTVHVLQESKEAFPAHQFKGLFHVDEGLVLWLPLLPTFLLQLSEGEDHIHSRALEPALYLWVDTDCGPRTTRAKPYRQY